MNEETGLAFKALDGYLLIRFAGQYTGFQRSITVIGEIADKCKTSSYRAILIDATEVSGTILGLERFRLMLAFARLLPPNVFVALLVTRDRYIADYLFETLLQKYRIDGAVFVNRGDAETWLAQVLIPAHKAV